VIDSLNHQGVHACALSALQQPNPVEKAEQTIRLYQSWLQLPDEQKANACLATSETRQSPEVQSLPAPGRPEKPSLVDPRTLPKRGLGSTEGRIALLHSLAHIEFNAINLALDAVYRFRDVPVDYVDDWLRVASDEGQHFLLLVERLQDFDAAYGDLDAHDGLWDMARRTEHDILVRMALVPRILEARGLDVAPPMIRKLKLNNDEASAAILQRIYTDEITHVAVGNRWFAHVCEQRQLDGCDVFRDLLKGPASAYLKSPYNDAARFEAGFTAEEMVVIREMETEYRSQLSR
jgi:uncharacterized ferritin-like protein (DUF455 family)